MQHKRQLGGSKLIERVRVFKPENFGPYSYLLFYVSVAAPATSADSADGYAGGLAEPRIVQRSHDESSVVREHILGLNFRTRRDSVMRQDL
jgi:hypothetical protein